MKLPPNWTLVSLEDICEIGAGNSAPQGDIYFENGKFPFIRMQDLSSCNSMFITKTQSKLNQVAIDEKGLKLWPKDSLVIPKSGASILLNHRALLGFPSYVVSHLAIIVPGDWILPEYLYFYSQTINAARIVPDSSYPSLRLSDIAKIKIVLPPIPEQEKIVEILKQANYLCDLRRQANEQAQDLESALFFDLFLRDKGQKDTWETIKLSKVSPFVTSGSRWWAKYYSEQGGKFLRVQNVLHGELDFSDLAFVQAPEGPEKERSRVLPGDLLITITGTVGRVAVAPPDIGDAYVSQHVAIARLGGSISPYYVSAFLNHPLGGQLQIARLNYGQTKPGLNLSQIQSFRIPKPPDELIEKFEKQLLEIRSIHIIQNQLDTLAYDLLQSVTARALSGELTETFRKANSDILSKFAIERDIALSERAKQPVRVEFEAVLETEEEREKFIQRLAEIFQPAVQQINESFSPTLQLDNLTQRFVLELSNAITPVMEQNREFVETSLLRGFQETTKSMVEELAVYYQTRLAELIEPLLARVTEQQKDVLRVVKLLGNLASDYTRRPDETHPRYHALIALSDEQYWVYMAIYQEEGFFTVESLCETLEFPPEIVRRYLALFESLGLIDKIALSYSPSVEYTFYVDAYRLPQTEGSVWADDVESLRHAFKPDF